MRFTDDVPPGYPKGGFAGAKKLFTVKTGKETYHRDGLVLQVIAWIAAHLLGTVALNRTPQMIMANKGLNGPIFEFDDGDVAHVAICEGEVMERP